MQQQKCNKIKSTMPNFNKLTINEVSRRLFAVDREYEQEAGCRIRLLNLFMRLSDHGQEVARYGLERHFYYCDKSKVQYDVDAIRDIIYDAMQNKSMAFEMAQDFAAARLKPFETYAYCADLIRSNLTKARGKMPVAI
jgi:hypothetical protein